MWCVTKAMRSPVKEPIMRREVKIGVFAVIMLGCLWGGIRFLEAVGELRADVPWWLYAGGIAVVLAIVYAIQLLRTWRTAAANPIDMIKTE